MGPVCCLVWPHGRNDVMGHGLGGHGGRREGSRGRRRWRGVEIAVGTVGVVKEKFAYFSNYRVITS